MDEQHITIESLSDENYGIGHQNGKVLFVEDVVPGDVVEVKVFKNKKKYCIGKVINFIEKSHLRCTHQCTHDACSGCPWKNITYDYQLKTKEQFVRDKLLHIANIDVPIQPIIAAEQKQYYRNKVEYTFSDNIWTEDGTNTNCNGLGFHRHGFYYKVVPISECFLQQDPSNEVRNVIHEFCIKHGYTYYNFKNHSGMMRNLIIKTTTKREMMVAVQFGEIEPAKINELMDFIHISFPQLTSLLYIVNHKFNETYLDLPIQCYSGQDYITEEVDGMKWKINLKSFFQTNTQQASKLYNKIIDLADLNSNDIIYDLYTGVGTIAHYVSRKVKSVIGIELVASAIEDAKYNASLNGITNTHFYVGDVKDIINEELLSKHGHPNVIIIDPPRSGVHKDVIDKIIEILPDKVIYISCNPATQARDIALLFEYYKISNVQPIDMFPNTYHVENIVVLIKNL